MTYPPAPRGAPDEADADADDGGGEDARAGDVFEGEMAHGVIEGRGRYTFAAAARAKAAAQYEGEYEQGRRHGRGAMLFPDGARYEGEFADGAPEGRGVYTYAPSGDFYSGCFLGGKKHGEGVYRSARGGCELRGTWRDGQVAEGRWVLRDGSAFSGSFSEGAPARGTHYFASSGLLQDGRYCSPANGGGVKGGGGNGGGGWVATGELRAGGVADLAA